MKIAITTSENTIDSLIDPKFGRCKYFLIIDLENEKIKNVKAIQNKGAEEKHGAGIKAAQQIAELGISTVITGNLGPNAKGVLEQLNIKSYQATGIAKNAVEKLLKNDLTKISNSTEQKIETKQNNQMNNERIFVPLLDDNKEDSKISPHFGHAPFFGLYDVEKKELTITENKLNHYDTSKSPIDQIEEFVHPTIIFAQDIGKRAIDLISQKGIALKTGPFNTLKEVIQNIENLKELSEDCGHEH